jgi:flavin reductase (DIM6/NTAB) family NADH-FMN oxidoreductase RutF
MATAIKNLNDYKSIKKKVLIDVIVEGLYQSGVLNDIRRAQELDQLDIEGIWDLKQLVDSCCMNLEDGALPIPNKYLFSSTVPTSDTIVVDDNRGDNDNASTFQQQEIRQNQPRQQQQQQYKSFHRRRRLSLLEAIGCNAETSSLNEIRKNYQRVLDNFLLSSTMKDCSVLLSIRREKKGFVTKNDRQEAKQYQNMEYRIACDNDDDYDYYVLVSIIDLDKKPASKLQRYHALDKQIVNHYSASYGLHHKLCFNEDGCDVPSLHEVTRIKGNMQTRLLYPNPVCLLTVYDIQSRPAANVMTITWLTPIDNNGTFVCSINKKRHTVSILDVSSIFVLNIPSRDMEQQVLNIGSCSGRDIDKFQQLRLNVCCPGWLSSLTMVRDNNERTVVKYAIALSDCIAHTVCKVIQKQDQGQHWLLVCKQQLSWCRRDYFDGKRFRPNDPSLSPYLTFLGSQTFGYVKCDT